MKHFQPADRRQQDRQPGRFAEIFRPAIDGADIHQNARTQCNPVQGEPVAGDGCLGLGAADQIVPAAIFQFVPGGGNEFLQRQIFAVQIV